MRVLIVGAGRMGLRHARVARRLGFETFTVDPLRSADFASLRQAPLAEVVAVATPIGDLAATAHSVMMAGCARLLVEKPLASTVREAESIVHCARRTGAEVLVGYSERFDPLVQLIKRELAALVGAPRQMTFERWGPVPRWESSGPAVDLAVHDIDLLHFFGFVPSVASASDSAQMTQAVLECAGALVSLQARYVPRGRGRRFSLEGTGGRVECDLISRTVHTVNDAGRRVIAVDGGRPDEPLLREWQALLSGSGPGLSAGMAALRVAEQLRQIGRGVSAPAFDQLLVGNSTTDASRDPHY